MLPLPPPTKNKKRKKTCWDFFVWFLFPLVAIFSFITIITFFRWIFAIIKAFNASLVFTSLFLEVFGKTCQNVDFWATLSACHFHSFCCASGLWNIFPPNALYNVSGYFFSPTSQPPVMCFSPSMVKWVLISLSLPHIWLSSPFLSLTYFSFEIVWWKTTYIANGIICT